MKPSEQHYNTINEGAYSSQLKKSLQRIKAACEALDAVEAEISVTSVQKQIQFIYGEGTGPTAGAIRNDKERLLAYVKLRRAEQTLPIENSSKVTGYKIPPIADEKIRSYVTLITHQNTQLLSENNRLKSAFKKLAPIDLKSLLQLNTGERSQEESAVSLSPRPPYALQDKGIDLVILIDIAKKVLAIPADFYMEVAEIDGEEVLRMKTNKKVLLMPKHMRVLRALVDMGVEQANG